MNFIRSNKKAVLFICLFILMLIWQPIYAVSEGQIIEINYFYISACPSCHDTEIYLAELSDRCSPILKSKNISLLINKYNTAEGENLNLLQTYLKKYNVPEKDKDMPMVFLEKTYLSGEEVIKSHLEKELLIAEPDSTDNKVINTDNNATFEQFSGFKAVSTFLVGFANGLTPCSLSMLLFFISLLIARNANILKMGLLYCAGKFITYFLLGTLLFKTLGSINTAWLDYIVKSIMLIAIIIFICLNAMDFFAAKGERYDKIKLQLPTRLRGINHRWIKVVSKIDNTASLIWVSFLLGVVTSVGEFLCTGQIYLTTILYVLHSQTYLNAKALLYFLEYNTAFITPLLIITLIIYKGREVFDVSEFIRKNMHLIKLINVVIFIALGLFLILKF
ncbi:MAG TPA: hypothetical protein VIK72_09550 [Clostridiaceae bacterium]